MSFWTDDIDTCLSDWDDIIYNGATIKGIFDNGFLAVSSLEIGVESRGPQCWDKDSDVSGIVQGDTLMINAMVYYVKRIDPDGTGMTLLILSKD